MIPFCPNCNKLVLGNHKERNSIFFPHCKKEIIVQVRNKCLFVVFFLLAMLPFVFNEFSFSIFDVHGYFALYFSMYLLMIFVGAVFSVIKNVRWERGED
jgi:hypothetical protein